MDLLFKYDIPKFPTRFSEILQRIHYKEHPLTRHYKDQEETRDWMFVVEGYYPSFFPFWKKCKMELSY